jgi:hypothetical protein
MKKQTEEQIRAINGAIEQASRELKRCKQTCRANGSPLRSITYRMNDDGTDKLRVGYKRTKRTTQT